MEAPQEECKYLFVVGSNEWIFDDFVTGYTKARLLGKMFRRLRIRGDGSVSQMILWEPSTTDQHTCDPDQTSSIELLGQGSGM